MAFRNFTSDPGKLSELNPNVDRSLCTASLQFSTAIFPGFSFVDFSHISQVFSQRLISCKSWNFRPSNKTGNNFNPGLPFFWASMHVKSSSIGHLLVKNCSVTMKIATSHSLAAFSMGDANSSPLFRLWDAWSKKGNWFSSTKSRYNCSTNGFWAPLWLKKIVYFEVCEDWGSSWALEITQSFKSECEKGSPNNNVETRCFQNVHNANILNENGYLALCSEDWSFEDISGAEVTGSDLGLAEKLETGTVAPPSDRGLLNHVDTQRRKLPNQAIMRTLFAWNYYQSHRIQTWNIPRNSP